MASRMIFALLMATAVLAEKATPIEKVIELLKGLQDKVAKEGKKDAEAYDKFACFCKEQVDEKLYSIEKSTADIADLEAYIELGKGEVVRMTGELSELSEKIDDEDKDLAKTEDEDKSDHAKYMTEAAELQASIDACGAAIDALQNAKDNLDDADLDLIQVHKQVSKTAARHQDPETLSLIEQLHKHAQAPAKYKFSSNHIIEDLRAKFKGLKEELDKNEIARDGMFMKAEAGLKHLLKVDHKTEDETDAAEKAKEEDVAAAVTSHDEEVTDKTNDEAFMDDLTKDCEQKAKAYRERSEVRTGELSAMTKAIEILEEGVKPNAKANKKLNGFVQIKRAVSFLQTGTVLTLKQKAQHIVEKIENLLQEQSEEIGSAILRGAVSRVQIASQKDHFAKVRNIINDLLDRLEEEAKAEAGQKAFCDKVMNTNINARDKANAEIESLTAAKTVTQAKKESLSEKYSRLGKEIAALKKGLNENTELRNDERKDNEETIASAAAGAKATEMALKVLTEFYGAAAAPEFIQTGSKKQSPVDRSGKTLGDKAKEAGAEVSGGSYHGAQGESKGIVGMLDVILSDFERTVETTKADEEEAQDEFEVFKKETEDDIDEKQGLRDTAKADIADAEALLTDLKDGLKVQDKLLTTAKQALEDVETMCVKGEETYEERVAKREHELKALKEAAKLFDEMK